MSSNVIEIGTDQSFTLIPEADGVLCTLTEILPSDFNPQSRRFVFRIDADTYENGATEDVDEAIQGLAVEEYKHYENVNIPSGPIGKRTKLYKLLKWMSGGDFETGDSVDLDDFLDKQYLVDFEHVDKMRKVGDGFEVVLGDNGRPLKKASIAKLRPAKRPGKAKAAAPKKAVTVPDADDDIDFEAEVD